MATRKVIGLSIPPDLHEKIIRHSKMENRTLSEYIREAVRHYMKLQKFEDSVQSKKKEHK